MEAQRQCHFCTSNMKAVGHKDVELLKRFLSPQAKILPRAKTAVCSKHQRKLSGAIKRARELGLVPYTAH